VTQYPLSGRARLALLAAVAVFGVLPYAEKLYRCWRTRPAARALTKPEGSAASVGRTQPAAVPAEGLMANAGRRPSVAIPQDVIDVIAPQHEHVRQLLAKVRQEAGQGRAAAFHTLRLTLALHETAEEQAIHPQVKRQLDLHDRPVTDRIAEEQTAGQTIAALEILDVDSDQFNHTFERFAASVAEHAANEENDEWPALRQISEVTIASKMLEQMQAVPRLAKDPAAPDIAATFEEMRQWARSRLPDPPG